MKTQQLVPLVVLALTALLASCGPRDSADDCYGYGQAACRNGTPYAVPDACFMRDYDDGWKHAGCESQWDTGW